ncbi:MAG: hypothetical protein M3Y72_18775 [Acidobacteriota bacterium]|nr:hypothetical protein [Acidobacteriota bacterium]
MSTHTSGEKPNQLVHSETPKHSEPHLGHEGTNYEGTDANAGIIIGSLSVIGLTLVIVFAFTIGIQRYIQKRNPLGELPSPLAPARVVPPAPQLQVEPWEDLPQMRAHEDQVLNSSGKDAEGHYHIPINDAMNVVVPSLKIEPNAPVGLTTPGGGGRHFAGSLADMPPQYQTPSIQGEIHKHAQ